MFHSCYRKDSDVLVHFYDYDDDEEKVRLRFRRIREKQETLRRRNCFPYTFPQTVKVSSFLHCAKLQKTELTEQTRFIA